MNKPTLVSLNSELIEIAQQREMILIESEGEITEANTTIINELELRAKSLLVHSKEKVSSYCSFLDSLEMESSFCEQKIKEVQAYVKRLRNTQDWLLSTAKLVIESSGSNLEGNFGNRIFIRKSTSTEVNIEAHKLPVEFQKITTNISANKELIKDKLKSGVEIEGCRLIENKNINWK